MLNRYNYLLDSLNLLKTSGTVMFQWHIVKIKYLQNRTWIWRKRTRTSGERLIASEVRNGMFEVKLYVVCDIFRWPTLCTSMSWFLLSPKVARIRSLINQIIYQHTKWCGQVAVEPTIGQLTYLYNFNKHLYNLFYVYYQSIWS